MLSSNDKRFRWAKADRQRETTVFRQFMQQWHPTVHTEPKEDLQASLAPKPKKKSSWHSLLWVE